MYTDPTGHLYQSEATDQHLSINSTNNYLSGLISSGGTGVTDYLKNSKALYNQDKFDKLNKNEKKATFRRNDSFSYLSEDSFIRLVQLAEINEINKSINKTKSINTGPSDFYLQATEQAKNQLNRALDGAQAILDAGGLIPVYGEPIDGINGLISLARGNKEDFALSLAAMAPLGGQAATVTKLGKKGKDLIEGTIDSYRVLSGVGEAKLLSEARSATAIRNSQGVVTGGNNLSNATRIMRGTDGNIGVVPKEITDNLRGRTFNNFDEFRSAFWQELGNSKYASEFNSSNISRMLNGSSPIAPKSQQYGKIKSYVLHHKQPIHAGGGVYDLDNLMISSPTMHQSILESSYHFGW